MADRVPYKSLREVPDHQHHWKRDRQRCGVDAGSTGLPKNWHTLSVEALSDRINDQKRPTPRTTIEAILWSVQQRGLPALEEPANLKRLSRCDDAAIAEIDARLKKLGGDNAA
jgi:hypothetical protein